MLNIPFNKSTDNFPKDNQEIVLIEPLDSFGFFGIEFKQIKVSYSWECLTEETDIDEETHDFENDPNYRLVIMNSDGFELDSVFYWIDYTELCELTARTFGIELEE